MRLNDVEAIVTRLRRDFPDVDAYAILQLVASAEAVVDAPTKFETARRVESLCRAGLRLYWDPEEFRRVVRSLDTAGARSDNTGTG